jgi:hypothetical protein
MYICMHGELERLVFRASPVTRGGFGMYVCICICVYVYRYMNVCVFFCVRVCRTYMYICMHDELKRFVFRASAVTRGGSGMCVRVVCVCIHTFFNFSRETPSYVCLMQTLHA